MLDHLWVVSEERRPSRRNQEKTEAATRAGLSVERDMVSKVNGGGRRAVFEYGSSERASWSLEILY
jgi:hypothetical protein